jgi:hypothetical protein
VAEGGGLLNRYTFKRRIEGSNPSVSANNLVFSIAYMMISRPFPNLSPLRAAAARVARIV